MNFGVNLYNWFLTNAQSLVLMIAVGLVFNAAGVKDVLLTLFNQIIGA